VGGWNGLGERRNAFRWVGSRVGRLKREPHRDRPEALAFWRRSSLTELTRVVEKWSPAEGGLGGFRAVMLLMQNPLVLVRLRPTVAMAGTKSRAAFESSTLDHDVDIETERERGGKAKSSSSRDVRIWGGTKGISAAASGLATGAGSLVGPRPHWTSWAKPEEALRPSVLGMRGTAHVEASTTYSVHSPTQW
jgi:hypothetical protein